MNINYAFHLITFDEMFGRPRANDILNTQYDYGSLSLTNKINYFLSVLKSFIFVNDKKLIVPAYWLMNNPYLMILYNKKGKEFVEDLFNCIIPKIRSDDKITFEEMKNTFVLGKEKQSSYWNDIKNFEKSYWDSVKDNISNYLDFLNEKFRNIGYLEFEKDIPFNHLFYKNLSEKFIDPKIMKNIKNIYTFLQDKTILSNVKEGVENIRNEYGNKFGMSVIVHQLNLIKKGESSLLKIPTDEDLINEIVSFCRSAYLLSYNEYFKSYSFPYSLRNWRQRWEEDIFLTTLNYGINLEDGIRKFRSCDIEYGFIINNEYLKNLSFSQIKKIREQWSEPDDENSNFKIVSEKILLNEEVNKKQKDVWDKVIDDLLNAYYQKKGEKTKLIEKLKKSNTASFRNKKLRIFITSSSEVLKSISSLNFPIKILSKGICHILKFGENQRTERRKEFKIKMREAIK